jgi:hypothetical protein
VLIESNGKECNVTEEREHGMKRKEARWKRWWWRKDYE